MSESMDGKVAIVTGGSVGIGRATALAFAKAGARVVIANRQNVAGGEEVASMIKSDGGEAIFVQADVSRSSDVAALVAKTVETFGRLDYACNNAGISGNVEPIHDYDEAIWAQVIDINLKGVWLCMKHEIPQMLKQGGGSIVNVASAGGLVGVPGTSAYTASKHGVVGLTKVAALEYAQAGVRVNAVCPGGVWTSMVDETAKVNPAFIDMMVAKHPIGRLGTPEEIANAVLWLCSDGASFVTGAAFSVDGGAVAQ